MTTPLKIPDLPEYVEADRITLREACKRGLVSERKGKRLSAYLLQRWCTVGCRVVPGGPLYQFPSVKGNRERFTTPALCAAWTGFVSRVRAEDARRQMRQMEAVGEVARCQPAKPDRLAEAWGGKAGGR